MRIATIAIWLGVLGSPNAGYADEWHGAAVVTAGKGYASTPMGQVHYRDIGNRETAVPFLLLHQTPWSMIEFADIQNEIAARGQRAVTVDTPGYGMSDAPKKPPSIADYADNLVPVLDALKIRKVILGGHHTGAAIAVAFAARHPDRVAALVIHGVPLYTAAERKERLARPDPDRTLKADGSHLSSYFREELERIADPPASPPGAFANLQLSTWAVLTMYLQDKDLGHGAAFTYDMEPDLKRISAPTLVMSDAADTLHAMDQKAVKVRPDFTFREFSKGRALSLMREPQRWAQIAMDFAKPYGK